MTKHGKKRRTDYEEYRDIEKDPLKKYVHKRSRKKRILPDSVCVDDSFGDNVFDSYFEDEVLGLPTHKKIENEPEVLIVGESSGRDGGKFRNKLRFSDHMVQEILGDEMLSDMTINYSLLVLHQQFPTMKGLEDTELGPKGLFSKQRGNFIQILFAQSHWLLACVNDVTDEDDVLVYDSRNDGNLSNLFIKQICFLRKAKQRMLNISIQPVQQQRNGIDCGILALCYAVDLNFKKDPVGRQYDIPKLRGHLYECLKNNEFSLFPTINKRKTRVNVCRKSQLQIGINCLCSELFYWKGKTVHDILVCSQCRKIVHKTCGDIRLDSGDIRLDSLNEALIDSWSCPQCSSIVSKKTNGDLFT